MAVSQKIVQKGSLLATFLCVIAWYASNMMLILLNKYLISFYGFKFPIFITLCHMFSSGFFSFVTGVAGVFKIDRIQSARQGSKVALLSLIFVASVMLANISLKHIPVSLNQAVGATTPFFAALLAGLLQAKIEHMATYATLIPVVFGTVIASNGEPNLHVFGLFMCISATFCRGLKSVVQSILMSGNDQNFNSQSLLMYMSPFAILYLIPFVMAIEPTAFSTMMKLLGSKWEFVFLFVLNVSSAYLANLFNFLVTKQLGALSLQVLGNLKGVVAAGMSVGIFKNPITPMGVIGYAITITGVFLYKEAKNQFQVQKKTQKV